MFATRLAPWKPRIVRFALGSGSTLIYAFLGLVRNKWLAHTLGAAGLGTLVQVITSMNWMGQAAGLGLGLPLARSVAAARGAKSPDQERIAVGSALAMVLTSTFAISVAVILFAPAISKAILGTESYAVLVRISAVGIAGLALAGTLLALFAGHGDVRAPLTLAAGGAVTATVLTFLLVPRFGLEGAMIGAAVLYPAGVAAAFLVNRRRYGAVMRVGAPAELAGEASRRMLAVGAAGLLLGLLDQGTLLTLRAHYLRTNGAAANGLLQAALAPSQQIGSLFYTYLASYAFGTLSAAVSAAGPQGAAAARAYTRRQWPALIALASVFFAFAMVAATPLLRILYSHRFDPARPLLAWALIGEFGRVATQVWMLGALPLGGMRLLAPIALSCPLAMAAAYALLSAGGAGAMSLPRAYAAAGGFALLVAGWRMSRRGVTLGLRELVLLAICAAILLALALAMAR